MKLFTKISLIVAAVTGGLGILAIIIGLAMGADIYDLNNMGIYISPHQQLAVSGVITEVVGEEELKQHHNRHHDETLHNYSCSLQGIKKLEVDVQNAKISIFAADDADNIVYYSNQEKFGAKVEGSALKLEDHSSLQDKIELELYIPVGKLKEIEIEAINGTIAADKIVADNVTIEIDNASVQIDELVVEDKAELQINAGQMIIGYYSGTKLETECAMGSILVVCEGNESNYNFDLECGMGNIQIDTDCYSGIGEEIQVNNGAEKSIKAECAMGEILLEFPNSL